MPLDFPARLEEIAMAGGGKPIEIWFADEARVGQKNKITRRWAKQRRCTHASSGSGARCSARSTIMPSTARKFSTALAV